MLRKKWTGNGSANRKGKNSLDINLATDWFIFGQSKKKYFNCCEGVRTDLRPVFTTWARP
jgi:hypothetical protein